MRIEATLHVVTDDEVVARDGFLERALALAAIPGIAFHLRAPTATGGAVYQWATRLADAGALLLVNDRVDVALAAGAAGVQLGRRGLAPEDARMLLGPERTVGVSVGSLDEARAAAGADFLLAGNVFTTPSHPGRPGIGIERIAEMVALGRPVVAIGGVTAADAGRLRRAGAAGVATIRGIWDAPDPTRAAHAYLEGWER
ncbi:MAG TPA: thiamine phosphate synthase [Longimicrobium sp.]|nr:thiamine phosphate synthase [Longimicrobium sp.]